MPPFLRSFVELVGEELEAQMAMQVPSHDLLPDGPNMLDRVNDEGESGSAKLAERFLPRTTITHRKPRSPLIAGDLSIRPPWTPPASPKVKAQELEENKIPDAELVHPPFSGRR
jgi:hypothetical protein